MKKTTILLATMFLGNVYAQNSNSEIPEIFPPKASVASLLRMDQIPVNLSTGIPDISHAIFNVPIDNILSYNMKISYHPSQIRVEEIGSELGVGWSVSDVGMITRTVNGLNDDKALWGILDNQVLSYGFDGYISANTNNFLKKRLYESVYSGQYDTLSDEYMFSFLGNSGKFVFAYENGVYIPKIFGTEKKYKIQYERDSNLKHLKSFTIIDDKGYQYIFDLFESDTNIVTSSIVSQIAHTTNMPLTPFTEYKNNWHLTKIKDPSNNEVFNAEYETYNFPDSTIRSTEYNHIIDPNVKDDLRYRIQNLHHTDYLQPLYKTDIITKKNNTYKLKKITILDRAVINFDKTSINGNNFLDKVKLYDAHNHLVNSFKFNFNTSGTKFVLGSIVNEQDSRLNYSFHYNGALPDSDSYEKDNWGYYNDNNYTGWFDVEQSEMNPSGADKRTNPLAIAEGILQYEISPTKGVKEYVWEANTFSDIATSTIEYYDIPENRNYNSSIFDKNIFNNQPTEEIFYIDNPQNVIVNFKATQYSYLNDIRPYTLQITPVKCDVPYDPNVLLPDPSSCYEETYANTGGITRGKYYMNIDTGTSKQISFYGKGLYKISFISNGDLQYSSVKYNIEIAKYSLTNFYKYLYGGGVRIKQINFWDKVSDMSLVNQPKRYFQYLYNSFNDSSKSSGVLNNKPVYVYERTVKESDNTPCTNSVGGYDHLTTFYGDVNYRTYNNNAIVQTANLNSSFVTYANVKVIESEGYTKNYFTTPLDYNDYDPLNYNYPFLPTKNPEKKYGLINKSEVYNSTNGLLRRDEYIYNLVESEIFTGAKTYISGNGGCFVKNSAISRLMNTYEDYLTLTGNQNHNVGGSCGLIGGCGELSSVLDSKPIYKKNIIPLLQQKKISEYYPGKTSEQFTTYTYNANYDISKEIRHQADLSLTETNYKYAAEKSNTKLLNANIVSTPLETSVVERFGASDPGTLVSKTETKYDDASHLFPSSIQSYTINNETPSTQITFNLYDSKGNLLQYTTKDDIPTAIIWGYNNTQPIAKVEGAKLSDIQQSLIDTIVNSSNSDASNSANEPALITALDNFRKNSALSSYQISTYTYDPLIGVTTVTPPSGIREIYKYDSTNRLESIKDVNGKLLKEFKYNYKP
ncbi:hypothetical protein AB4Y90_11420 [Chryseobacterium sp. 2TAF14]|uniref:hypothetical protein n=1 Tax=Chryseobacterium sp. 2TAF14 TaxID=3233007 RepID=UPI003F929E8F